MRQTVVYVHTSFSAPTILSSHDVHIEPFDNFVDVLDDMRNLPSETSIIVTPDVQKAQTAAAQIPAKAVWVVDSLESPNIQKAITFQRLGS